MQPSPQLQSTIDRPVSVTGFGFWSGLDVCLEFRPANADTGVVFVRRDLPGNPRIPARIHHRVHGPRRTTLVHNGCAVELVEHVLAALHGLQIDNCEIWIDRAEVPGMDGSSQPFVDALSRAGRVILDTGRVITNVTGTIHVGDEDSWITAEPSRSGQLELIYKMEYDHEPMPGTQEFSATLSPGIFATEIAAARTFLLESEANQMRSTGVGRRVTNRDILIFNEHGPVGNILRYENECARHKLLDMVGDLALLGTGLAGKFTAFRSGHRLNAQMAFALLEQSALDPAGIECPPEDAENEQGETPGIIPMSSHRGFKDPNARKSA
ncbi:MAG: UDP-3-O-acyl-N-acetylglucosamine deacetylase [Planctomycetota bacterium]